MENRELTLNEIQDKTFLVLKKIKEICEEENIKYWLSYGTLIGAIRHEGFIPWDDDIDIQMPREDYEKFISYCMKNKEKLKPFELFHYKTSTKYIYPIARFSDSRYINIYNNDKDYGLGLFVDIYPMDDCNAKSKKLIISTKFYRSIIGICGCKKLFSSVSLTSKIKRILFYPFYKLINLNKLLEKYDSLFKNNCFGSGNYDCFIWTNAHPQFTKAEFEEITSAKFCGDYFNIPKKYDYILSCLYNDYMTLPPEEERIGHHFYKVYKKDTINDK